MAGGQPSIPSTDLHSRTTLLLLTIGCQQVENWWTGEVTIMSTCSNQDTRRSRVVACSHWGDLDLHWICFSPRALFVPCMSYSRLMVAQSRSRTLSSSQRFGKIQPVFTPARRGGKAERTKAVRWFLWTVATLSSLWQPFPRHPTNRWLQFLLPKHQSATCGAQLLFSATHLSPAWPWLEHSRKYPSYNCQEKIYLVSHQLKVAIVKQINRYPM